MNPATHDRIIQQAIACLARNSNAGLKEIARAAGVGRATLYRYFRSRADLVVAIKLSAGDQLQRVIEPVMAEDLPAREKLVRIITRLVPLGSSLNVSAYFDYPVKQGDPRVKALYLQHKKRSKQLCLALKKEGAVSWELPVSWLIASMDALVFEAWASVERGEIAPKQAPWLVLETFLSGHGTRESREWLYHQKEVF
jgi:AcrR family transcriptional regulator